MVSDTVVDGLVDKVFVSEEVRLDDKLLVAVLECDTEAVEVPDIDIVTVGDKLTLLEALDDIELVPVVDGDVISQLNAPSSSESMIKFVLFTAELHESASP